MAALNKAQIEAAWRRRGEGGQLLRDDAVKGLVLALRRDHATWRLEYRLPGLHPETGRRWPNRALTLGRLAPGFHLQEARAAAREHKALVAKGIDPATTVKAELTAQLAATADRAHTVRALVESYTAARSSRWRPATARAFKGDLREIAAELGDLPVNAVTRRALATFLRDFQRRKAAAGFRGTRVERLRMLLGSMFKFALDEELIDLSPAQRLPIPAKSEDRERTLDAKEIATAWAALSAAQAGIGRGVMIALQLSLVLGQRIGAVASAREVDLDLAGTADPELVDSGPRWRIRGEAGTKARQDRILPLSPLAVELFRDALALPGRQQGYVFRGKRSDAALAQQSLSRAWGTLRRAGKVPADTVAHDLRRSARTWWPELSHGQEKDVLERVLGHAVGSRTERVYDRALWLREQRAVLDSWARKLATITAGGAEIATLPRRSA